MTAVSVSTRSSQFTTQVAGVDPVEDRRDDIPCVPPVRKPMKIGQLSAAPMNSEPVVTTLAAVVPIQRPPSPAMIAASSGRKTIACTISRASG